MIIPSEWTSLRNTCFEPDSETVFRHVQMLPPSLLFWKKSGHFLLSDSDDSLWIHGTCPGLFSAFNSVFVVVKRSIVVDWD